MDSGLFVWKLKLSLLAAAAVLAGLHQHDRANVDREHAARITADAHLAACLASVGRPPVTGCSTGLKKPPAHALQAATTTALPLEVSASVQVDD